MLLAGLAALAQSDFKRVLAYSTISQIGYMFLALGVGAYVGRRGHFVTHALFKSALFLGAGAGHPLPPTRATTSSRWAGCGRLMPAHRPGVPDGDADPGGRAAADG